MDNKIIENTVIEYIEIIKEFEEKYLNSQYYYECMLLFNCPLYKQLLVNSPRYKNSGRTYDVIYSFTKELRNWIYQYCSSDLGILIYGEKQNSLKKYLIERITHAYTNAKEIRESQS